MKAVKGFTEAYCEKRLAELAAAEQFVRMDSDGQELHLIKPDGVSDGEVVADTPNVAEAE